MGLIFLIACQPSEKLDTGFDLNQEPTYTLDEVSVNELIITEIMINPTDCDDTQAEYIEIRNNSGKWFNINGLIIKDNISEHQLTDDVVVSPYSEILARISNEENCFLLGEDFTYNLQLNNDGDSIEIANSDGVLDSVDFSSWEIPEGASLILSEDKFSTEMNDVEESWCASTTPIANEYTNFGSPGIINPTCSQETSQ
jgi:hypothetical protein